MAESSLELLVAPPISSDLKRRGRGEMTNGRFGRLLREDEKALKFVLEQFSVFRVLTAECVLAKLSIFLNLWHYLAM